MYTIHSSEQMTVNPTTERSNTMRNQQDWLTYKMFDEQTTVPGTFHGGEQTTVPGTFHGGEQTTVAGTFHCSCYQ